MGSLKQFSVGLVTGFLLLGCASATFPYKYYGLDAKSYEGFLRGDKPENDLDLNQCTPTATDAAPCMVLKTIDMLKLKQDYKDMQLRLIKCGG